MPRSNDCSTRTCRTAGCSFARRRVRASASPPARRIAIGPQVRRIAARIRWQSDHVRMIYIFACEAGMCSIAAVLALCVRACFRSAHSPRERCPVRSPTRPVPRCRRSHDDSGCRRARRSNRRRWRFRVSRPSGRRLRDLRGAERIRAGASSPCGCRPANGSPCPSPCTSPSWKKRSSRPRRWASATCKRFRWRSAPSRTPSSRGWALRRWVRRLRSPHRSRFLRTPVSVNSRSAGSAQTSSTPGRIRVRRCTSTASTSLGRRWSSCSFSISIASKCCADRRAPCTDATPSVGR